MVVAKRYVLRLFMSLKNITAHVVDRSNGEMIAMASTAERGLKNNSEVRLTCNAKAATVIGEVLAMRLKVRGIEEGLGRGIHMDVKKEIEKKGFKNHNKVWAIVNSLKSNGVKLIIDDDDDDDDDDDYDGTFGSSY